MIMKHFNNNVYNCKYNTIVINSKDIKLKALIIMRYYKNYSSIREGMQAAMSIETLLQAVASSRNGHDSILALQCSHTFNLHSLKLVVIRESIWRLCGYSMNVDDRYLDDLVSIINKNYNNYYNSTVYTSYCI